MKNKLALNSIYLRKEIPKNLSRFEEGRATSFFWEARCYL